MTEQQEAVYQVVARSLYLAAGIFVVLWFLDAITVILLFFLLAVILAIALNPPVTWLEQHRVPRIAGTLLLLAAVALLLALLLRFVVPVLIEQVVALAVDLPAYLSALAARISGWLPGEPDVVDWLTPQAESPGRLWPTIQGLLTRVGRISVSLVTLVVLAIVLVSTVAYALINPRPLLKGYLTAFPKHLRAGAERAFVASSGAISGWVWSNVIVGGIEGVAAGIFLAWIGVPGALLWAALTFLSELVPKVGPYLMTIPPTIVAFAVDPMTALWVVLFYMALNEFTSDVISPWVRGAQMEIHPVSLIFAVLALASAFGLIGAIVATPVTGIFKAFYQEFYLGRQPRDERLDERVEAMLLRRSESEGGDAD